MKIKDGMEAAYIDWKAKNTDPYGAAIFQFAEEWADGIEQGLRIGRTLEECAKGCSEYADTLAGGITGFMYGAAVSILSQCWEHGEQLRRWHNTRMGQPEAEGTINPALLTVGCDAE